MIVDRYRNAGIDFAGDEKFVAINNTGELSCGRMGSDSAATTPVRTAAGIRPFEGSRLFR